MPVSLPKKSSAASTLRGRLKKAFSLKRTSRDATYPGGGLPPPNFQGQMKTLVSGDYEVRLAETEEERRLTRQLRYDVFVLECGSHTSEEQRVRHEEFDGFDAHSDYLIVIHKPRQADMSIVGSYRLLLPEHRMLNGKFFTEQAFDLTKLLKTGERILELDRSCVARDNRNLTTMNLLWKGLAAYTLLNHVEIFVGRASFIGTDPLVYSQAISYLHYNYLAPLKYRCKPIMGKGSRSNFLPKDKIDERMAMRQLPPVIKGYFNGGRDAVMVGDGLYIDYEMNACDILMFVFIKNLTGDYRDKFLGELQTLLAKNPEATTLTI